jgi:uncharacterized membrane protein YdjX (TVP38/TMEM64 family)
MHLKLILTLVAFACVLAIGGMLWVLGGVDPAQIQAWVTQTGVWGPLTYCLIYFIATLFILPSTALNLLAGALFGPWLGTLWTTLAAVCAAVAAFHFSRTTGRTRVQQRLQGYWQWLDQELQRGGWLYIFAIRLLPIMPYGLVNLAAGLTSIRTSDYLLGTITGTVLGAFPFVFLGSTGVKAVTTGDVLPLLSALLLLSILIAGSTWYRQQQRR